MKWTKTPPTEAGWYWWRDDEDDLCPSIVNVFLDNAEEGYEVLAVQFGPSPCDVSDVYQYDCEWSDQPIPQPEETKPECDKCCGIGYVDIPLDDCGDRYMTRSCECNPEEPNV
jgi:hypothetical protein